MVKGLSVLSNQVGGSRTGRAARSVVFCSFRGRSLSAGGTLCSSKVTSALTTNFRLALGCSYGCAVHGSVKRANAFQLQVLSRQGFFATKGKRYVHVFRQSEQLPNSASELLQTIGALLHGNPVNFAFEVYNHDRLHFWNFRL